MKVNLEVDAGYAIDFLSILDVKALKIKDQQSKENFRRCKLNIRKSIGSNLDKIYRSKEYKKLFCVNKLLWEIIDKIRTGKITARMVDDLNYQRWILKNNIQKRYFGSITAEQKSKRS